MYYRHSKWWSPEAAAVPPSDLSHQRPTQRYRHKAALARTAHGWAAQPQAAPAATGGASELKTGWNKRQAAEQAVHEKYMLMARYQGASCGYQSIHHK